LQVGDTIDDGHGKSRLAVLCILPFLACGHARPNTLQ
jgi:hypothetical protein